MPDYWLQASVVKAQDVGTLCAFYVHCTLHLAIYLPISGHIDQKQAEIYKLKRTSFKHTETTFSDKVQMLIQCQNQYLQHPWQGALCSPLTMPASPKFWFSTTQFTDPWIFKVITWYLIFSLVHLFNLFLLKHLKYLEGWKGMQGGDIIKEIFVHLCFQEVLNKIKWTTKPKEKY